MAKYRHKIVQALSDLIMNFAGKGKDPIMRAVWYGIKGQVPSILQILDDNEEAIEFLRAKMLDALDIKEPIDPEQLGLGAIVEVLPLAEEQLAFEEIMVKPPHEEIPDPRD